MTTQLLTISDAVNVSGEPTTVVIGSRADFRNILTRDSLAYDFGTKTVTATVRKESKPDDVIDVTLEDVACGVEVATEDDMTLNGLDPADAADYRVAVWTMTGDMSAHLEGPTFPARVAAFTVQYFVEEDDFMPDLLRFRARRPGRAIS